MKYLLFNSVLTVIAGASWVVASGGTLLSDVASFETSCSSVSSRWYDIFFFWSRFFDLNFLELRFSPELLFFTKLIWLDFLVVGGVLCVEETSAFSSFMENAAFEIPCVQEKDLPTAVFRDFLRKLRANPELRTLLMKDEFWRSAGFFFTLWRLYSLASSSFSHSSFIGK